MTHLCISKLAYHCFRYWLGACSASSHHLNQWWFIVNWTPWNKFEWNTNGNINILIQENAFENVICKWQPFCLALNVFTQHTDTFDMLSALLFYSPAIKKQNRLTLNPGTITLFCTCNTHFSTVSVNKIKTIWNWQIHKKGKERQYLPSVLIEVD